MSFSIDVSETLLLYPWPIQRPIQRSLNGSLFIVFLWEPGLIPDS